MWVEKGFFCPAVEKRVLNIGDVHRLNILDHTKGGGCNVKDKCAPEALCPANGDIDELIFEGEEPYISER